MKKYLVFGLVFVVVLSGCISENKDEELLECDKFKDKDFRDYCYKKVAINREDLSICDKIQTQLSKDKCYAIVKGDLSICDKMQNQIQSIKDECYKGVARA